MCEPELEAEADGLRLEWFHTWQRLVAEADDIERECAQVREKWLDDNDDSSEASIDHSGWDRSLWGGLAELRSEMYDLRRCGCRGNPQTVEHVSKKVENIKAIYEQLSVAFDVACQELETALKPVMTQLDRIEGTCAAASAKLFHSQSAQSLDKPRWRGPCGGDGGVYASGRLMPAPTSAPAMRHNKLIALAETDCVLKDLSIALQELDEQASVTGETTDSWSHEDHAAFMRVFRMFRRQTSSVICDRLADRFPKINRDAIEDHLRWCVGQEQKQQSERRELITKWRLRMEQLERDVTEAEAVSSQHGRDLKEQLRRAHYESQRRRLKEWQSSKEQAAEQALLLKRSVEEQRKQEEKERKKKEAHQKDSQRRSVQDFQKRRAESIAAEKRAEAKRRPGPPSAEVIDRINARSAEMIRKQRQSLSCPQLPSQSPRKDAKSNKFKHVRSKLQNTTVCFQQKVAARLAKSGDPSTSQHSDRQSSENVTARSGHAPERTASSPGDAHGSPRDVRVAWDDMAPELECPSQSQSSIPPSSPELASHPDATHGCFVLQDDDDDGDY